MSQLDALAQALGWSAPKSLFFSDDHVNDLPAPADEIRQRRPQFQILTFTLHICPGGRRGGIFWGRRTARSGNSVQAGKPPVYPRIW
jgi:hypothetical protein